MDPCNWDSGAGTRGTGAGVTVPQTANSGSAVMSCGAAQLFLAFGWQVEVIGLPDGGVPAAAGGKARPHQEIRFAGEPEDDFPRDLENPGFDFEFGPDGVGTLDTNSRALGLDFFQQGGARREAVVVELELDQVRAEPALGGSIALRSGWAWQSQPCAFSLRRNERRYASFRTVSQICF